MATQKVKIATVARYSGHQVKSTKAVDVSFKFDYSELVKYIQLVQLLNENVDITIKRNDEPAEKLGIFMIKNVNIDHDGEATIKFNSMVDQCEVQLFHHLVGDEPFKILFKSEIESENEEQEEEDNA